MGPTERFLIEVIEQAAKTINSSAHYAGCSFSGCNCGSIEKYKINRTEFFRLLNRMRNLE